jgi:hypothetical protein
MNPAEIAAALTPAQVRALRDPWVCDKQDFMSLTDAEAWAGIDLLKPNPLTKLGRLVLAELDKRVTS